MLSQIFSPTEVRCRRALRSRRWRAANQKQAQLHARKWRLANKKHIREHSKFWRGSHKAQIARRRKMRRAFDPIFALSERLRGRIYDALHSTKNSKLTRSAQLLGCSPIEFKQYLESKFQEGMSWANRHLWHIDHEKPISSFDLSTLEGQQAAFHYTNCQPLWAIDNLRKSAKVENA